MKIAIAGYGIEGRASYDYFIRKGHQVVIVDEHPLADTPIDASVITGEDAFKRLKGFDMVVRTASLAPRKIITDGKVWSATNEFFAQCPGVIIGVTGSKGKGTTCSLITSILRAAGHTVHLVGNIGVPALSLLDTIQKDDFVIYEMSSFQLWDLEASPHVAVVLMIEPDHLDVHSNFDEYVTAKSQIVRWQNVDDIVVYNGRNVHSRKIAETSKGKKIAFQSSTSAHVEDGYFWYGVQRLCPIDALKLPGVHNLDNACAAIDAVQPWVEKGALIAKGLSLFEGLNHRLKFVRTVSGVDYYDDSIATTPGSAVAALKAFDQSKIIILGGSSKGADFSSVAEAAGEHDVKVAIVIGDEAVKIETALRANRVTTRNLGSHISMDEIVQVASEEADSGDVVILSPACASFGMFKNYSDRGDKFIEAVKAL